MPTATATSVAFRAPLAILRDAVRVADTVCPSGTSNPTYQHIRLAAVAGMLEVSACDVHLGLRATLPIPATGDTPTLVHGRNIAAILGACADGSAFASPTDSGQMLHIQVADGEYDLPRLPDGEDLPPVSGYPTDSEIICLPAAAFARVISRASFAADESRSNAVLSGALLRIGDGTVLMASTDGKILAEARLTAETPQASISMVLPLPALAGLSRLLALPGAQSVRIAKHGTVICFRVETEGAGTFDLTSRQIEGNYPNYTSALAINRSETLRCRTADLRSAISRASLLEAGRPVVVSGDGTTATISLLTSTRGCSAIRVPLSSAAPFRLGLASDLISDLLKHVEAEEAVFIYGKGLVIHDGDATYLIMPISLPD